MPQENPFILEGDQIMREGERRAFALTWNQFSTISTAGTAVYLNGSVDTTNVLSGSTSVVSNVQTVPLITIPTGYGGLTIVIESAMISGGMTYKTGIVIHVLKPGAAA